MKAAIRVSVSIRQSRPFTIIAFLLIAAFAGFFRFYELTQLEFSAADALVFRADKLPTDPSLVYVAIDDSSVQFDRRLDLEGQLGPDASAEERQALTFLAESTYPWSRDIYASILDRLFAAGARVVALDVTFPTPRAGDEALAAALAKYRDRVVVTGNFEGTLTRAGFGFHFTRPSESVLDEGEQEKNPPGFANFWPEFDEVIRFTYPSRTLGEISGHQEMEDGQIFYSFAARIAQQARLPMQTTSGAQRISFAERGSFPTIPICQLFTPRYWKQNLQNGAFFRDKIVVIGAFGNWHQDQQATPIGIIPGAELHLHALNSLLHGALREPPVGLQASLIVLAGLLAWWLSRAMAHPLWRFAVLAAGTAAWVGSALFLLSRWHLLIPTIAPLGAWTLIGAGGLVFDIVFAGLEKSRFRRMLERYVSKNVVSRLLHDRHALDEVLGGAVRPVTVLFSDIRNFTSFSAMTDARLLVAQLNEYFTAMVECVFRHGGTVDKFMGDALMAVWGNLADVPPAEGAQRAMRCALDMAEALEKLNRHWLETGRNPLRIGIALNHGEVVCGNIGSPHRMEFTVIGDAVNVAWRLQEATKLHPGAILLGEAMLALAPADFETVPAGVVRVAEMLDVEYFQLLGPGGSLESDDAPDSRADGPGDATWHESPK